MRPLVTTYVNRVRRWWKATLGVLAAAVALQTGASLLVRTHAMRTFLTRKLAESFGRPVEVQNFSANLFPALQLDAYGVSVGEDPSFGHEYFLRAERLSAGLRWIGLLAGRFELGTLQLDRPSLILVRDGEGRWNLERWLPAATPGKVVSPANSRTAGPPLQRLRKINIDDGRVNFKLADEKISFAFVQVNGSVEQMSLGRWRLDLESEPWRSGVPLQLAGTVRVQGDVAGTSTRLQPAHLQVNWEKCSLADIFRLIGGHDFGVRGTFAGEAVVDSSQDSKSGLEAGIPGDWGFSIDARAAGIHRWDLTERDDNPRIGIHMKGRWNPGLGITEAREVTIEAPRSNFRGRARLTHDSDYSVQLRLDSAGFQAADIMDWYRAFWPDVAEAIRGEQYFTGSATLRAWPLKIEDLAFSSVGGRWTVPGLSAPFNVRALRGGTRRAELVVEPFGVTIPSVQSIAPKGSKAAAMTDVSAGLVNVSFVVNPKERSGSIHFEGQTPQLESVLVLASAFGRNVRRGWDLKGRATGDLQWEWTTGQPAGWVGHADLSRATLEVAGLNQPLVLDGMRADWSNSQRKFTLEKVGAFGASWAGSIEQAGGANGLASDAISPDWTFQLQADHLDASDLDRWIGPRARPNWLQRLLPSALTEDLRTSAASAVLKRIRAQGELKVDEVTMEKIKLKAFRAHVDVEPAGVSLSQVQAQWSGGTVQGSTVATFSANPKYEVTASFSGVSLAQTPWLARVTDRVVGMADGNIELRAAGIGREDLLKNLTGKGELRLSKIELRGWDLAGSMEQGEWRAGVSRWATGSGTFHLNDGDFELNGLKLNGVSHEFLLKGSISFAQNADLRAESHTTGRTARSQVSDRFMTISGPLNNPKFSLERATAQQPGD